jgi:phosphopantothenoylcysteine decarboxylase/phosphopantothenate--cysteine ligase
MKKAVLGQLGDADIIIMAAAVSDIVPEKTAGGKLSKRDGLLSRLKFKLNENILEILSTSKRKSQFLVGFAAESGYNIEDVRRKFSGKNIDMIVANDISGKNTAIGSDYNEVEIIRSGKDPVRIPRDKKRIIAGGIWDEIIKEARE